MALKFPDSADSADLAAAGYSQVIILGGGVNTVTTSATADYLLLAGGGGGGGTLDGGGGAGGYRTTWGTGADGSGGNSGGLSALETALTLNSGTAYSITVGQGGEGGIGWTGAVNAVQEGHVGRSTSISGSDITTVTTVGGGNGSYHASGQSGTTGGSGGGGGISHTRGLGTAGEGTNGGAGATSNSGTNGSGGGGGGASTAGSAGGTTLGGDGGDGLASTITGVSITRAGGGGGGHRSAGNSSTSSAGGDGGGGSGGWLSSTPTSWNDIANTSVATHGRAKYGGGGGGGGYSATFNSLNGGNGGSGIAIFRIPSTVTYSASQLANDVSSLTNCTASYLNTQVYTDDTNFGNVALLLNGEGSSIIDRSSLRKNITVNGATINSSLKKFGSGSIEFDGTGDYLDVSVNPDFTFDGDFTVEAWVYPDAALSNMPIIDGRASNIAYQDYYFGLANVSGTLRTEVILASGAAGRTGTTNAIPTGQWSHIAFVRSNGVITPYVNGVPDATTKSDGTTLTPTNFRIGAAVGTPNAYFDGKIDDLRITTGVARYTSNFSSQLQSSALPNGETSTGGDHVITFTVTTEDPHDGGATTNDGTATWTPTLNTVTPAASTTWTIPEGVDSFSIMAIGAGGAAGYSDSSSAGGGGGGGGLAYLNNIAVTQGNNEVQSITVSGGQLGIGNDSTGGDGTDLTVTMNLATANPAVNLSGYNLNPYGQDSHDSSFAGILYVGADRAYDSDIYDSYPTLNLNFDDSVSSTADQFVYVQPSGPFGAAYPFSVGVEGAQTLFEIEADANYTYIQSLAETDPNTTNRWGYNSSTQVYSADSYVFRNIDNTGRNSLDSIQYYDSDVVSTFFLQNTWEEMYKVSPLGTFDSIDVGNGAFTLFRIFSEADAAQIGALPGNSPYVDSNGQIVISTTGDPYDFNGYGPQDLNQILIIKNLTP